MAVEQAPVDVVAAAAAPNNAAPAEPAVYFTLESSDNQEVKISSLALQQSKTLADLVANLQYQNGTTETIPMDNISKATLDKVVEWCEHHKGEPIPVDNESSPKIVVIPDWDDNFLKMDNDQLFYLILAVNYLDVKQLMNYACRKVALMAKGRTPEELSVIFGIPTDEEDEAAERRAAERKEAAQAAAAGKAGSSTGGAEDSA
ncbi:hypothetical protein GCK72_026055 [Caenorhabditis remanei]|uniref:Skp1-related protein n=1 Tax=Caenorhabditis remanei TaxID=31234 RepID=A0A6A5G3T1_CAERE|nr:hypothetical protein GCK72_026055 [Caenorhabditis remanei]KAF1749587.1 hypothetical protein GCK72_026055 [Caenorhabditis remanei]